MGDSQWNLEVNDNPIGRQRWSVVVQGLVAFAIMWLAFRYGPTLAPLPSDDSAATRMAFAIHWLAVPGVLLMLCVLITANGRLVNQDAFSGTRTPASRFIEISIRCTQNTLEQCALAAICWPGLAVTLPHGRLGLIPVCAGLFALGRILFWIGYQISPNARALGFVLTFMPTAIGLVWLLLWLL